MSPAHEKWEPTELDWKFSTYAYHAAKWGLDVLRPSIFAKTPRKELTPTSWLDGLRGFAAFLVYCQHHQGWAHVGTSANEITENVFGYKNQYYFACLPGIRLFFTGGHVAVAIFFFISGYVLSAKPLALKYAGELAKLEENLAGAMFKRWPRLFLPAALTTFVYATSWHLFGIWTAVPAHKNTYAEEMVNWYKDFMVFSWPFRTGNVHWPVYNFHLWSIAVEFRGSIVIFTTLLALSRCRRNARLLCEVGLIFYFLYIAEGMLYAMFVAGMLLCDLDTLARNDDLPSFFYTHLQPYKKIIFYTLFVIGIYLSGVPSIDFETNIAIVKESPGWNWLARLKPPSVSETDYKWLYLFWAALFLISSIARIPWLKAFFETRFNQYLGRISFSLYLVHGPLIWTLADRLYLAAGLTRDINTEGLKDWLNIFPLSRAGPLGLEFAFLMPHLIMLPVTLWVAEVCTRLCDRPSLSFAQWIYRKALAQDLKY
ncbi:related to hard surface induced protein 3 (sterol glycosyl transferase) [Phialocephala subalpina]|uniref:Related to hard surface induced protein 3 (Sterol glycosyl transferase) n=1 Tax=Phialocephala subalpina TaxID=576137 RepID=A0A1L7WQC0_9HELO|nr:related to hard surface induced protein 3 (sterol glycosyl transferase) [Phialocephala subalpina]